MRRILYEKLIEWKISGEKPLLIKGARQVGKTYLMLEFAKNEYESFVYINFEKEEECKQIFEVSLNPIDIIRGIEIVKNIKIDEKTLIIFDEIGECKRALTSLKYFNEEVPNYKILCSGSNMGIALHPGTSYPVGKVTTINMYPMTYEEFLMAMNEDRLVDALNSDDKEILKMCEDKFINYLRLYYYIGGMPEVVKKYIENKDLSKVQELQNQIISFYKEDFGKHISKYLPSRIINTYESIPSQLTKENKKFIFGVIKKGARAKDYELALMFLKDIGLLHYVYRVSKPAYPLNIYKDIQAFKIYLSDVGLLSCMCHVEPNIILHKNNIFVEYKGSLTEQYVMQQLVAKNSYEGYYYSNETSTGEIDFLYQYNGEIIPIEVKAEVNLQAKSLRNYCIKYKPRVSVRTSMMPYKVDNDLINIPLYDIGNINHYLKL